MPAWLTHVSPRTGGAISAWTLRHTPLWFTGQGVIRYDPFLAPRLVVARGDEALPYLMWAWDRVDATGRVGIADGIGSLGPAGAPAMAFLMARLPAEDGSVRRAIAGAMGAIGTRDALVNLVKLSFDQDARVAEGAARCMLAVPREQRYLVESGLNAFIRKHHAALPPADLFRFWEEGVEKDAVRQLMQGRLAAPDVDEIMDAAGYLAVMFDRDETVILGDTIRRTPDAAVRGRMQQALDRLRAAEASPRRQAGGR
ncbi:MAG: hypothetical protein ABIF71_11385 [Planctomycetota bacterium]